jgi:3D (Asp-Asp-Asp) domain-containing protein
MAIQDFTAGQILTAAQMDSLQANDYNWTVSTKTASYTLVAADKGTRVVMNNASATTITVNTNIFAAGDILWIQNINTGTATITAGTCTVNTAGSLALAQWQGGTLYFTSASTAIFF